MRWSKKESREEEKRKQGKEQRRSKKAKERIEKIGRETEQDKGTQNDMAEEKKQNRKS